MSNKKIKSGDHNIGDLDMRKAKVKVTIYIDGEVLEAVQREARRTGVKYQSLLSHSLRERFLEEENADGYSSGSTKS